MSQPGIKPRLIDLQTLYHGDVKARFYRKAKEEVIYITWPCDMQPLQ